MIVAIFVFAPIGLPAWYWLVLTRILGVPLIAGHLLRADQVRRAQPQPALGAGGDVAGLKLQLLTTREPDLDQLAVAIAALEAVLALEKPGRADGGGPGRRRGRRLAAVLGASRAAGIESARRARPSRP